MVMVKERRPSIIGKTVSGAMSGEVIAFCPVCKALQTLWFTDNRLMETRKFSQYGDRVYHDCGSRKPCHLYCTG